MKKILALAILSPIAFDASGNDNSAFVPEFWAEQVLSLMIGNMEITNLFNKDYNGQIQEQGDVVNVQRPRRFKAIRKTDDDDITTQAAKSDNIQVKLDQRIHTSFIIKDGEQSLANRDLINLYAGPAALAIAEQMDALAIAQAYQFKDNQVGSLDKEVDQKTLVGLKELMTKNKVQRTDRHFVVTPGMEATMLLDNTLSTAQLSGDGGARIRTGVLNDQYGFMFHTCQSTPFASGITAAWSGQADASVGAGASATITVKNATAAPVVDQVVTFGGRFYFVTAVSVASSIYTLILDRVIDFDLAADDAIKGWPYGTITSALDDKYGDYIVGSNLITKPGLLTRINGVNYGQILGADDGNLYLDQLLVGATSAGQKVGFGPNGGFGFAFTPDAMTMVTRTLAMPRPNSGVSSFVGQYNGVGIRVTIAYDYKKQGHVVTIDTLAGFKKTNDKAGYLVVASK